MLAGFQQKINVEIMASFKFSVKVKTSLNKIMPSKIKIILKTIY